MATTPTRVICLSADLLNSGKAVRFDYIQDNGTLAPAIAIRYQDRVFGYINACKHIPVELDFQDGRVFDLSGQFIICSMHGALYRPDTGKCAYGPCQGQSLKAITLVEQNGEVWVCENTFPPPQDN